MNWKIARGIDFFSSVHCASPPLEAVDKKKKEKVGAEKERAHEREDKQKLMNKMDKQMGLSVSPKWRL